MLPREFRRASIHQRRQMLEKMAKMKDHLISENRYDWALDWNNNDFSSSGKDKKLLDLSDSMVEQAIGYHAIPMGLAGPLTIDGCKFMVPMATEEPSVIAAVSYMGRLCGHGKGIVTNAGNPIMSTQIFVEKTSKKSCALLMQAESAIRKELQPVLASMQNRGGGWRGMETAWLEESQVLVVNIHIDVRDAMGANLLNNVAEHLRGLVGKLSGGSVIMAILSNKSSGRMTQASVSLPVSALSRAQFKGTVVARRIVLASKVAQDNLDRAITHNKGIMNGVDALAIATGNDTRAIEAAAHAHACRNGQYHPLSHYYLDGNSLCGKLEIPLPFATTGGAVNYHPSSRWALGLLNHPSAILLSRIAAAVGLAQNLAALRALVSEGIQSGHMSLHTRRLEHAAKQQDSSRPFQGIPMENASVPAEPADISHTYNQQNAR